MDNREMVRAMDCCLEEIRLFDNQYRASIIYRWLDTNIDVAKDEVKAKLEKLIESLENELLEIIKDYLNSFNVNFTDKSKIREYISFVHLVDSFEIKPTKDDQLHEVVCKFALMRDPDYYLEIHIVEGKITNYKTRYVYEDF